MTTYIGIDPGKSGAIAVIDGEGHLEVYDMPPTIVELGQLINEFKDQLEYNNYVAKTVYEMPKAVLEKVRAMPKQGVSSTFTFGEWFGAAQGALAAAGISHQLVTPTQWKQKILAGLNWKGCKDMSVDYVLRLYPDLKLPRNKKKRTDCADAICLALYAKEVE